MPVEPTLESSDAPFAASLERKREPALRLSASRGLGFIILYVGAQFFLGLFGGAAIAIHYIATGGDPADSQAIQEAVLRSQGLIAIFAALLAGFVFAVLVFWRYRGARWIPFRKAIGLTPASAKQVVAGACSGIAIAILYVSFTLAFVAPSPGITPGPTTQMALSPGIQQQTWTWFALLGSPLFEEFVVRGVLLACFAASWGIVPASIVTTAFFVGLHYSEIAAFWPATLALTTMSFAVAALRIKTASLIPAISGHLGYNVVLVTLVHAASAL